MASDFEAAAVACRAANQDRSPSIGSTVTYLYADAEKINFASSDGVRFAQRTAPCEDGPALNTAVNTAALVDAANDCAAGETVKLDWTEKHLVIVGSNGATTRLVRLAVEEPPPVGEFPTHFASVGAKELAECIDRALYCTIREETLTWKSCVRLSILGDGQVSALGTDGRRASRLACKADTSAPAMTHLMLPAESAKRAKDFLGTLGDDSAGITYRDGAVKLTGSNGWFSTTLAEAKAPPYERMVLAQPFDAEVTIPDKGAFVNAVRSASKIADPEAPSLNFGFGVEKGAVRGRGERGEKEMFFPCAADKAFEIRLRGDFVANAVWRAMTMDDAEPVVVRRFENGSGVVLSSGGGLHVQVVAAVNVDD